MEIHEHHSKRNFFDQFSSKAAFLFGLVLATAAMSLIGFGITIAFVSGDGGTGAKKTTTTTVNTNSGAQLSFRPVADDDHIRGDENAEVTLIEYSDLQCPFCKTLHPTINQVLNDYKGKVRLVYRHYPLTSLHPQAYPAALASECINDLGGSDDFWSFLDTVFNDQTQLGDTFYAAQAKQLGINEEKFQDCYQDKQFDSVVQSQAADAGAAGAQGTPYTLVIDKQGNVTPVNGALPYSEFQKAIDAALAS